jgi:hypothetical protein
MPKPLHFLGNPTVPRSGPPDHSQSRLKSGVGPSPDSMPWPMGAWESAVLKGTQHAGDEWDTAALQLWCRHYGDHAARLPCCLLIMANSHSTVWRSPEMLGKPLALGHLGCVSTGQLSGQLITRGRMRQVECRPFRASHTPHRTPLKAPT